MSDSENSVDTLGSVFDLQSLLNAAETGSIADVAAEPRSPRIDPPASASYGPARIPAAPVSAPSATAAAAAQSLVLNAVYQAEAKKETYDQLLDELNLFTQTTDDDAPVADRLDFEINVALKRMAENQTEDPPSHKTRGFAKQARLLNRTPAPAADALCNALARLGELKDQRSFETILRHINAKSPEVREAAVNALGMLAEKRCAAALIRCLRDKRERICRQALNSLSLCNNPHSVRPALAFGLSAVHCRVLATECISQMDEEMVVPLLIETTLGDDTQMSALALTALGHFKHKDARATAARFIGHSKKALSLSAIASFAVHAKPQDAKRLYKAMFDKRTEVRRAAVETVSRLPHASNLQPLLKLAANENEDPSVLEQVAIALGMTDKSAAIPGLCQLAQSENEAVQLAVASALGQVGMENDEALDVLADLAQSSDTDVKFKALVSLTRLKDPSAMPILAKAVNDDAAAVRRQAVVALGQVNDKISLKHVVRCLQNDPSDEVRSVAATALGRPGRRSVIPLLQEAMRDEVSVRCQAAAALAAIGDKSVIPILMDAVADIAPEVQFQAINGLARMKAIQAVKVIAEKIDAENSMVARAAEKAVTSLSGGGKVIARRMRRRISKTRQTLLPDFLIGIVINTYFIGAIAAVCAVTYAGMSYFDVSLGAAPAPNRGTTLQVRFSPEGKLATVSRGGWVEIWDTQSEEPPIQHQHAQAAKIEWTSPDELLLATSRDIRLLNPTEIDDATAKSNVVESDLVDPVVQLRRVNSNLYALQRKSVLVHGSRSRVVELDVTRPLMFDVMPDEKLMVSADANGTVYVLDMKSGKIVSRSRLSAQARLIPTCMDISPDGTALVFGTTNGQLSYRKIANFDTPLILDLPGRQRVRDVCFMPDSKSFVVVDDVPAVSIWSVGTGKSRRLEGFDGDQAVSIDVSPDGKQVALCNDEEATIWVLNAEDGSLLRKYEP